MGDGPDVSHTALVWMRRRTSYIHARPCGYRRGGGKSGRCYAHGGGTHGYSCSAYINGNGYAALDANGSEHADNHANICTTDGYPYASPTNSNT